MKNKKYIISMVFVLLAIFTVLIVMCCREEPQSIIIRYVPIEGETTNIRKIIVENVSEDSSVVRGAVMKGFVYDPEDERVELPGDQTGELIFYPNPKDVFSVRIKYKLYDDRIAPVNDAVSVTKIRNGVEECSAAYPFKKFTDGDWVYVCLPGYVKGLLVCLGAVIGVCVCGMTCRFFLVLKGKRKTEPCKTEHMEQIHSNEYMLKAYAVLSFAFTVFVIILRAHNAGFTWDESRSYLVYTRYLRLENPDNMITLFSGSMANNHLLNTVAGSILVRLTHVTYDELLLRIPNILFGILYLIVCCCLLYKRKITAVTFSLFVWNYYLNEFFGLFRGYGMACSLVLMGLLCYGKYVSGHCTKNDMLTTAVLFLTLACSANTVVLLLEASVLLAALFYMIRNRQFIVYIKTQWMFWIPLGISNIGLLKYHLYVAKNDEALFAGKGAFFPPLDILKSFAVSYTTQKYWPVFLVPYVIAIVIALIICCRNCGGKDSVFLMPLILFMILVVLCDGILKKGYPFGRALIPFYPLFILSLSEVWGIISGSFKETKLFNRKICGILSGICICLLILSFVGQISFDSVSEWRDNAEYKRIAYDAMVNPDTDYNEIMKMHHPMPFYREQIREKYYFDIYEGKYE